MASGRGDNVTNDCYPIFSSDQTCVSSPVAFACSSDSWLHSGYPYRVQDVILGVRRVLAILSMLCWWVDRVTLLMHLPLQFFGIIQCGYSDHNPAFQEIQVLLPSEQTLVCMYVRIIIFVPYRDWSYIWLWVHFFKLSAMQWQVKQCTCIYLALIHPWSLNSYCAGRLSHSTQSRDGWTCRSLYISRSVQLVCW